MKRMIKRISCVVMMAALLALSLLSVSAISTADAKEQIVEDKECSLTLTYRAEDKYFEGLDIQIFRCASVTADFQYSMYGEFAGYNVVLNGITSQTEWDAVCDTVGSYVVADGIEPDAELLTDENGVVSFTGLKPGIYYVKRIPTEATKRVIGFEPFLIAVPGLGEDGLWIYDVDALPKPGETPVLKDKYKVIKVWQDAGKESERPDSVNIDIFADGILRESVVLNDENNWTYEWASIDDTEWTVAERGIDRAYSVTIEKNEDTFVVTNTRSGNPKPPQTGDSGNIFWFIVICAAGILLVVLGLRGSKRYS